MLRINDFQYLLIMGIFENKWETKRSQKIIHGIEKNATGVALQHVMYFASWMIGES